MRKLETHEIARKTLEEFRHAQKFPIAVVLDNVRSLLNVGSIFRTCDAFLVGRLYLCGLTGTPPHREIEKTALGSTDSVNWTYRPTTLEVLTSLRQEGFQVVALEQTTESLPLYRYNPPQGPVALVFGNEIKGVDAQVLDGADCAVEIPQYGTKHSLNIAVAAGIAIHHVAAAYAPQA